MGTQKELKAFVKSRDKAFTAYAVNDDWKACLKHFRKYGQKLPNDETIAKAGVLKAIQEITSIPVEVKIKAAEKCISLGFKPTMW